MLQNESCFLSESFYRKAQEIAHTLFMLQHSLRRGEEIQNLSFYIFLTQRLIRYASSFSLNYMIAMICSLVFSSVHWKDNGQLENSCSRFCFGLVHFAVLCCIYCTVFNLFINSEIFIYIQVLYKTNHYTVFKCFTGMKHFHNIPVRLRVGIYYALVTDRDR